MPSLTSPEGARRRKFFGKDRKRYRSTIYVETGLVLFARWRNDWLNTIGEWQAFVIVTVALLFFFHLAHTTGEEMIRKEEQGLTD